jgi:hypothetical protein
MRELKERPNGAGKTTTLGIWSIDLNGCRRSLYALTWADGLDGHPKQASVMSRIGDDLMYLLRDRGPQARSRPGPRAGPLDR